MLIMAFDTPARSASSPIDQPRDSRSMRTRAEIAPVGSTGDRVEEEEVSIMAVIIRT
uniref:Uncharacterized protein n=1 Tax=Cupriavidus taiwanensis TaxID=164546 RepID=A0A375HFW4_9BURK|nr:protein of unknown function [Cupriavidus taiwanensis]